MSLPVWFNKNDYVVQREITNSDHIYEMVCILRSYYDNQVKIEGFENFSLPKDQNNYEITPTKIEVLASIEIETLLPIKIWHHPVILFYFHSGSEQQTFPYKLPGMPNALVWFLRYVGFVAVYPDYKDSFSTYYQGDVCVKPTIEPTTEVTEKIKKLKEEIENLSDYERQELYKQLRVTEKVPTCGYVETQQYLVKVNNYPTDIDVEMDITINNYRAWGLQSNLKAKKLRSPEFKTLFLDYIKLNITKELQWACKQVIIDARYYASKKTKYGSTSKADYKKNIKENKDRLKVKWETIDFDPKGRTPSLDDYLTLKRVIDKKNSLPIEKRNTYQLAKALDIERPTLMNWFDRQHINPDRFVEGDYD